MRHCGICLLIALFAITCEGAEVVLVEDGHMRCAVVLPKEPTEQEQRAAEDLALYLGKMAGEEVTIHTGSAPGALIPLRVGSAAVEPALRKVAQEPEGFVITVSADGVNLAGTTPAGTSHAVYAFLERLGCRWYMPGEIGEVVPRKPTIALAPMQIVDAPDFRGRYLGAPADWSRRNRLGGDYFPGSHSWNGYLPPAKYFKEHPEYYALVGCKRQPSQLCTSNPDVIRLVAEAIKVRMRKDPHLRWVGIGPNDGGGFCECDNCRALDTGDWDPFAAEISITDRFLTFANAVAAQVHEEFPDAKFAFYIYHNYMRPPLKVKADPSITGALAPIALCRVHGLSNPHCPERAYWGELLRAWPKVLGEVYHRGYAYNLAGPQVPISLVSVWREEVPACKRAGIVGFRVESQIAWASHMPTPYIMAKLFWDADADVEALLQDYFTNFFGPAAEPMHRYWQTLDEALYNADFHTGAAWNVPDWYPPKVMQELAACIHDAKGRAKGEPYRERVRIFARAFEYLEQFQAMIAAQNGFDFDAAVEAYNAMQEIVDEFMAYDPPLFSRYTAPRFLPRFYKAVAYQGRDRTKLGNELAAAFDDEWDFALDPDNAGEELRFFAPALEGGNWQKIRTFSASWSDQGLRYYKGTAWYRQTVTVPERFKGRKLFLWFGAVDEAAKVWMNGTLVGEQMTNGSTPLEFDITDQVLFGRPNVVVVKVTNKTVNEIGTGGITQPVMIWAQRVGRQ